MPSFAGWKTCLAVGALLAASLAGIGCGGGGGGGAPPPAPDTVSAYLKALPPWSEFSPTEADVDPHAVDTVLPPPEPKYVGTVQYVCQTTPYAARRTPTELVMYSPNVEILWPGSLLQGKSYRDGEGVNALLPLTIAERTPIKVTIPALKTEDNFREVVPDLGNVNQAIGGMIGAATASDLRTPSTISFAMESYNSEEQLALSLGISGRYMGFKASANFDYEASAEETTVVVHFMEKMFEVVVAPPQTPGAFFSSAFTQAKLDEQIALGRIGDDNLPIYVSNVVYGRMFTFAMTSNKTESEIRATLQAAYSFGVGKVSTELTADQKELIQKSKISIATLGGDTQATLDVIRSGDWRNYFTTRPPLASATPLSYTFRSLADGTVALVTETASYGRTVCEKITGTKGFLAVQSIQLALPTPFTAATGDLNGDGRVDLVWNHRGTTNDVQVAFGKTDGTFTAPTAVVTIPGSPAGAWTDFTLVVADVNGDGRDDLVWNRVLPGKNETYVALSDGDGTFTPQPVHVRTEAVVWDSPAAVCPATIQARSISPAPQDLLWTRLGAGESLVASTIFGGASPVDLVPHTLAAPAGGWGPYATFGTLHGDLTGDGVDDLVFGAPGHVLAATNDGLGAFTPKAPFSGQMTCGYSCPVEKGFRVADVDGDGKADVLRFDRVFQSDRPCVTRIWVFGWICIQYGATYNGATQVLASDGAGGFVATATQWWPTWDAAVDPYLVDVSGDGKADLVFVQLGGATAKVTVALAETNATGDFTGFGAMGAPQSPNTALPPGAANWNAFRVFFGDVNGDGKTDLIFNDSSAVGSIYVYLR